MHEGAHFTHIMASRSHTLYIGVTGDLRKRVFQHNWKEKIALIESENPAWVDLSRDWDDCEPADFRRVIDHMND